MRGAKSPELGNPESCFLTYAVVQHSSSSKCNHSGCGFPLIKAKNNKINKKFAF